MADKSDKVLIGKQRIRGSGHVTAPVTITGAAIKTNPQSPGCHDNVHSRH